MCAGPGKFSPIYPRPSLPAAWHQQNPGIESISLPETSADLRFRQDVSGRRKSSVWMYNDVYVVYGSIWKCCFITSHISWFVSIHFIIPLKVKHGSICRYFDFIWSKKPMSTFKQTHLFLLIIVWPKHPTKSEENYQPRRSQWSISAFKVM